MRYYEYLSPSKINMLYAQLQSTSSVEKTTEIGASVSLPATNISGKRSSKTTSSDTIFNKIKLIEKETKNKNKAGTIIQNNDFIIDNCSMICSYGCGLAVWRGSFFDRSKKTLYRFLMYGSEYNLCINQDPNLQICKTISGSSKSEFFHALIEACKCSLHKDDEVNDIIERTFIDNEYDWIHDLNLEKWQLVEWFFYDRGQWTTFSPSVPLEFFARVDFRQTITFDYFEQSKEKNENAWTLFSGEKWVIPYQTEQIVYVYASPIYVARKEPSKHIIHYMNDRSYLYIPAKELQKICTYTANNRTLFKAIISLLYKNGLMDEARMMEEETNCKYGISRNRKDVPEEMLTDSEVMNIISKYVTTTEPS